MISVPRIRRGITIGVAAVVVGSGVGLATGAAASAPSGLSRMIVAKSLPGFSLLPGGEYDGPIPKSQLEEYSSSAQWTDDVADGMLNGFIRAWSHQYTRGLAFIYMSGVRMPDAAYAPVFTSTIEAYVSKEAGATSFHIAGVTGATGYRTTPPQQIGRATGYWIIFTRGTIGYFLYAVGPPRTTTTAQLVGLARQQAARAASG